LSDSVAARGRPLIAGAVLIGLVSSAYGAEGSLKLKDDAELATVRVHCSGCHSVDYIQMNAPILKRAGWEAEVRKMIKVMGAPIPDADAAAIIEYLTRHYGVE
jgi:hypothetical protein